MVKKLLIANRGEIAIRIARAAADLDIPTVAVFSEDDAGSLHAARASEARQLKGRGPSAYMDVEQLIEVAGSTGCDAVHPGYGFLSESAAFARACANAGLTFAGPRPEILDLLGDKAQARALASTLKVPVLPGVNGAASLEQATAFLEGLPSGGSLVIKAVFGGGGRGMRRVDDPAKLEEAYERCRSEARAAFGRDDVYVEQYLPQARHIEVQVAGDGSGTVSHLGERDCTIQRRNQKLIEIAPSPFISPVVRERLAGAAVRMAEKLQYNSLGTFEFLVDGSTDGGDPPFFFIEANPRLQVEHTVTEEVTGVDLVVGQLRLAAGQSLSEVGLDQSSIPSARGFALQVRVNSEEIAPDGTIRAAGGRVIAFEQPAGPGVRVDTAALSGFVPNPSFDSLLAKVIVRSPSPDFASAAQRADRTLAEFRVEGIATNIGLLRNLLCHPDFVEGRAATDFIEQHIADLAPATTAPQPSAGLAGAKIDSLDPLAVLEHGKASPVAPAPSDFNLDAPEGMLAVNAPMQGTIVAIEVSEGDHVSAGQSLLVMEAMKMEHVIAAPAAGVVNQVAVAIGDAVYEGHPLVLIEEKVGGAFAQHTTEVQPNLDHVRPDLAEVKARHELGLDEKRPDAVERRRKTGQRTARENIEDLCDPGSFVEYGPLVIAAQRRRRPVDELIERTPADGLIAGVGTVNGDLFDESRSRCIAMSYDYTVLAGTQGQQNHRKKDRMFELAEKWCLPIVFFTEGGGGRPGDTDGVGVAGLDCLAFNYFGKLSGYVPLVGIVSGRCFAGNAALLGCCDVIIATRNANIGMGGPAMIEGGGLGIFKPEEVGPTSVQAPNGVVDVLVEDEAQATKVARQYLSYFQGAIETWSAGDQRLLRGIIPENRRRIYDVRRVISTLADEDSVLELRRDFGLGMVTALARIEGRPVGIIANNPTHLAGAIDSNGADKAARFMQLCDAFDIPIVSLCDTPGIMVGPEVEKTALVRHASRMFVTGAGLGVPVFTIILRKAYGLGAQAMAGGSFRAPFLTVSWPTGEFGGMGLEGAVKLGYRNDLAAIEDPAERKAQFDEMVERMYQHGKAVNTASHFEIDDVIDPADTRRWIMAGLRSMPPTGARETRKRGFIDTW